MKFFTAALLAIGAIAIKIKDDTTQGPPPCKEDGESEFPFPEPDCPPKPEGISEMSPLEHFEMADVDQSGKVDEQEGFNALYCAVVWGEMERDEAEWLYEYLGEHAAIDGDDSSLSKEEAEEAFATLEKLGKLNEERAQEGKRPLKYPPPTCGDVPEGIEDPTIDEAFAFIDKDGSGKLDEQEG